MGVGVSSTPRPFYPQERPATYCTEGWVGPRAGLDGYGKSRPHRDSIPRTIKSVASRYTDWAIPAAIRTGRWIWITSVWVSGRQESWSVWESYPRIRLGSVKTVKKPLSTQMVLSIRSLKEMSQIKATKCQQFVRLFGSIIGHASNFY